MRIIVNFMPARTPTFYRIDMRVKADADCAKAVKAMRKELGLKQVELAERLGVSLQRVKNMEGGSPPSYGKVKEISQLLGFEVRLAISKREDFSGHLQSS